MVRPLSVIRSRVDQLATKAGSERCNRYHHLHGVVHVYNDDPISPWPEKEKASGAPAGPRSRTSRACISTSRMIVPSLERSTSLPRTPSTTSARIRSGVCDRRLYALFGSYEFFNVNAWGGVNYWIQDGVAVRVEFRDHQLNTGPTLNFYGLIFGLGVVF